jgi:hypothetical protein
MKHLSKHSLPLDFASKSLAGRRAEGLLRDG